MQNLNSYPEEQYIDQQQPVQDTEIYANMMQEERIRNVLSQLSPDEILTEVHWRIRGYIKDPITKQWKKLGDSSLNIEPSPLLISRFISFLSSILNQNTTMSNLSADEINSIMRLVINWTSDDLDSHQDEYGISGNYTEMTRIGYMLCNHVFITLKRAMNGNESKRIFNALSLMENLNQNQPNQKKGFWSAFKSSIVGQ
jgi:hypothetical protein